MDGLRDLAAQCGQPTALAQLSNSVTAVNPSILADSQIYKSQTGMAPNLMSVGMQRPAPDMMNEFKQYHQHPMKPQSVVPMPAQHAAAMIQQSHNVAQQQLIQADMMKQMAKEFDEKMKMEQNKARAPVLYQQPPQQQHPHHRQPMFMHHGQPTMMMPMMYPQPMMQHMHQPMIPQQQLQPPPPKQEQVKAKINTNGETDMADEKQVQDELDALQPTESDLASIKTLLNNTDDAQMQNSQFFQMLRKIATKPPIPDTIEHKEADPWSKEFEHYNPADDMDWGSYMDQINPLKPKDPEYEFAAQNHFVQSSAEAAEKNMDNIDYFEKGRRLMREGDLNEAILAFEASLKQKPNRSEAWRYLGQCHADNEAERPAIAAFIKCHELDPYDLDALLALGVSYTNEIDPYRALKFLRSWVANHPDYSTIAQNQVEPPEKEALGGWLGSKREHARVVELFLKAGQINPKDADLHIVLGVLFNITSEYDKAELHFKKALQARPKDPTLWNKLGATQANGQNCSAAIKAYSRALQLKPNYVRALSNLGISFANQGMHVKACQSYLASLKRNNGAESIWDHLTMSLMHLNRGDLVEIVKNRDVSLFQKHFDF